MMMATDISFILPLSVFASLALVFSLVLCAWIKTIFCSSCSNGSQDGYRAGVQRNQPFLELTEDITFEPLPTVLNNNTARVDELERICLVYSREALRYNGTIGQGWFGWIVEGSLQGGLKVIVKMLRDDANQGEVDRFKMEHKIWNSVRHPNLAGAIMGSFDSFPLLSVLESTQFRSAKTYLREHPNKLDSSLQLQLCMDATAGLDALFNKGIAHPDLATRTCILTRDLTLKLCDYGLGRSLYPQDYWPIYTDSVPVRWCSSSQIQKQENRMVPVYTKPTCSDNIWALGVLIWEILCWGEEPYKHLTNKDVVSLLENDVDMRPYFKLRMIDENNMRARCILTLVHNNLNPLTRSSPKSILTNLDNIGKAGELQLLQVYNELLDESRIILYDD